MVNMTKSVNDKVKKSLIENTLEPNLTISISGNHPGKSVVSSLIANALNQAGVTNVHHLNFEEEYFKIMQEAVEDSKQDTDLPSAKVLIIEWDDDELDTAFNPHQEPVINPPVEDVT